MLSKCLNIIIIYVECSSWCYSI